MEGKVKSEIGVITESLKEYVCECLCQYPKEAESQEDLDQICDKCKMGQYLSEIEAVVKID